MRRKVLIPTNSREEVMETARDNLAEIRRLGITIDEVRILLSEWVSRNLGMHDMASKVRFCIDNAMPVAHKSGHISITELAIFRKEVKLENGLPEDIL